MKSSGILLVIVLISSVLLCGASADSEVMQLPKLGILLLVVCGNIVNTFVCLLKYSIHTVRRMLVKMHHNQSIMVVMMQ